MILSEKTPFIYYKHFKEVPTKHWPWSSFSPIEIASHGNHAIRIVPQALDRLQSLFDAMHCDIIIDCGYRDSAHNAAVGGAPLSNHKYGIAFDLSFHGIDKEKLYNTARACGFTGIGHYATFLHVDCGRRREWRE